jgi:predicted acetyltransferase
MIELRHERTSGPLPTSEFNLYADGRCVGWVHVHHKPSHGHAFPDGAETHIGYVIEPTERRKGYGREILRLGLIEARAIGLQWVFIGADVSNVASVKIIEANGGELLATFRRLDNDETVRQYRIGLGP